MLFQVTPPPNRLSIVAMLRFKSALNTPMLPSQLFRCLQVFLHSSNIDLSPTHCGEAGLYQHPPTMTGGLRKIREITHHRQT